MNAASRCRAVRTSLSTMPGISSMVANASRPPTQPVSRSVATTVAVRGISRSNAISPTIEAGLQFGDGVVAVDSGMGDFGAAGADQQKGNRELALLHEHLSRRRGQRLQLRRQRRQGLGWAAGEDLQFGEFVGSDDSLAGHVTRLRRGRRDEQGTRARGR